jgi:predicted acyltransferase
MPMQDQMVYASAVLVGVPQAPENQTTPQGIPKRELSQTSGRLVCIDALRGFDMFLIIGADHVLRSLAANSHNRLMQMLGTQFEHVAWDGCHLYDLIFPVFLFVIGVSMPFSFSKRLARGDSKASIYGHIFRRVAVLVVLGGVINGHLLSFNVHQFTASYSVLMVLALGYMVASLILLNLNLRGQIITTIALLVVYWALMDYVPVPGHVVGVYKPGLNLGDWLNNFVLGRLQGPWHNGWILQSMTNGATAMLGVFAGYLLRSRKPDSQKLLWLLGLAVACLVSGWVWSFWFPIIKNRWTSTYVLWAGGWSYLALALFYWIIDVRRYRTWAFPFIVVGMNAIVAYMAWGVFGRSFRLMADTLVGGLRQYTGTWYDAIGWFVAMAILWFGLYCLYRTRTIIRI